MTGNQITSPQHRPPSLVTRAVIAALAAFAARWFADSTPAECWIIYLLTMIAIK